MTVLSTKQACTDLPKNPDLTSTTNPISLNAELHLIKL